jgi:hypothetical protein
LQVGTRQGRQRLTRRTVPPQPARPRRPMRERLHDDAAARTDQRWMMEVGGGRWMRRNKSRGGERADRERSEHATAAASRHPSIHPSSFISQEAAVFRCSLCRCVLTLFCQPQYHHVQRPAPSHRRPPLQSAKSQQELDTKRDIGTKPRYTDLSSSSAFPNWGRRRKQPARSGRAILLAELLQPFWWYNPSRWAYIEEMVP